MMSRSESEDHGMQVRITKPRAKAGDPGQYKKTFVRIKGSSLESGNPGQNQMQIWWYDRHMRFTINDSSFCSAPSQYKFWSIAVFKSSNTNSNVKKGVF